MSTDLAADEVYCRDCGEVINERAEIYPECGIRQKDPEPITTKEQSSGDKDSGIAAVASFIIPGLGQVYNGEIAKGIIAGVVTVLFAITGVGLIIAVPLWIWLVYDAYKVAETGGASPSTSSGSGTTTPRTTIERALTWQIEQADDPELVEEAKEARDRFRSANLSGLSASDTEFILDTVERYNPDSATPVREALGR